MEGDCYVLASKYLQTRNVAYIVSEAIRGKYCTWNFKGNTQADFAAWCRHEGLACGGNPFYVGYDSVWFDGVFMPHQKAIFLEASRREEREKQRVADSLKAVIDTLPLKNVTIEYLEIGKAIAEQLGFSYSDYIGTAKFFEYEDLFSVTMQAKRLTDTTFMYRTYTTAYDSTLHVFWGGQRDRLKSSNVTANGIVSNNYEQETYGLTFDIVGMKYTYTHSSDYEHSISGSGKLSPGKNAIFGAFQRTYSVERGVPGLCDIPLLGYLFKHLSDETETRYVFIYVTVGEYAGK